MRLLDSLLFFLNPCLKVGCNNGENHDKGDGLSRKLLGSAAFEDYWLQIERVVVVVVKRED